MSRKLLPLTVASLLLVIALESLGAPYRLVQGVCILGALTLVVQIPNTIEIVQSLRRHDAGPRSSDEP
jgi:hypothetical protein